MKTRWIAIVAIIVCVTSVFFVSQSNLFTPKSILIVNSTAQPHGTKKTDIAIFLTIDNSGEPDTLLSANVKNAAETKFVNTVSGYGLAVPALSNSLLASDGVHIVATGVSGLETPGQLIPIELTFERAGKVAAKARFEMAKMDAHAMMGHSMVHQVEDGQPKPSLSISIAPNLEKEGWQLNIDAENFTFSEEMVGKPHVAGIGHGHVYLNGIKLGRVYGSAFHIGALPSGTHEIMVGLNTNEHRPIVVDGSPVLAKTTVRSE